MQLVRPLSTSSEFKAHHPKITAMQHVSFLSETAGPSSVLTISSNILNTLPRSLGRINGRLKTLMVSTAFKASSLGMHT